MSTPLLLLLQYVLDFVHFCLFSHIPSTDQCFHFPQSRNCRTDCRLLLLLLCCCCVCCCAQQSPSVSMLPAQSQSCADARASAFFPRGRPYSTSSKHVSSMSYAHPIPRRYVLTAAIVLSGLALALFRLPSGTPVNSAWWAQRGGSGTQAAAGPAPGKIDRRVAATWLSDVRAIPVNHDGSGALKQVSRDVSLRTQGWGRNRPCTANW